MRLSIYVLSRSRLGTMTAGRPRRRLIALAMMIAACWMSSHISLSAAVHSTSVLSYGNGITWVANVKSGLVM